MKYLILAVLLLTGCTYTSHKVVPLNAKQINALPYATVSGFNMFMDIDRCFSTYRDGCL